MNTQAKAKLAAVTLFGLTAGAVLYYPSLHSAEPGQLPPPVTTQPGEAVDILRAPVIEAVFVLDTTGSMGGLIQAAKDKIWSIASTMAAAQPAPEIRMGLVAYRDRGDEYVTRVVDLTKDLDAVHSQLMQFQAQGGGDEPESVNEALQVALKDLAWSQDPSVYRVIFLVGDAPAHMDYANDVPFPVTLGAAQQRGIRVNAIQCGEVEATAREWRRIAQLGAGSYFQVAQGGSAIAVATPYDDKLASLAAELDDTRLYYGKAEERSRKRAKLSAEQAAKAAASPSALAGRATFVTSKSGKASLIGEKELVDEVSSGRMDVADLPPEELPEPLVGLDADAQRVMIATQAAKRKALEEEIQTLSKQRSAYIANEVATEGSAESSLDHKIFSAVRKQAADKGIRYEDAAPVY